MDKTSKVLDHRNLMLWEEMNKHYTIQLQSSPEPNYIVNFKEDLITIYVDENNLNPASFTHELLHIYLKYKGILIADDYTTRVFDTLHLSVFFKKELRDYIGNCLEHNVMYSLFLDLGFDKKSFIADYKKPKLTVEEARNIQVQYRSSGGYNLDAIDAFIGKFFGAKSCKNSDLNYSRSYKILEQTDKKLYKLLCDFWDDWTTFDMNNPEDSYSEILDYHFEDLLSWQEGKKIS